MKKIISFSLFGNNPLYTLGAIENVKLQPEIYPDWICRFYIHTPTVPKDIIDKLDSLNCELVFKTDEIITKSRPGMFWRFEVLKDNNVERFIVRDGDSRIGEREKNCVIDWEKSGKCFHIIRDNIVHGSWILGGMWGATKVAIEKIDYDKLLNNFNINNTGIDQDFLSNFIYPIIKDDVCIHDDYHLFKSENPLRIPHTKVNDEYIGKIVPI